MARRILIACNSVPGYGGAGTASYDLFERLLTDDLDVHYLSVVTPRREAMLRARFGTTHHNPRGLRHVHYHRMVRPLREPHPGLAELLAEIDADLLVGCGHTAAHLIKDAAPERKMWMLATGVAQVSHYFEEQGVDDACQLLERLGTRGLEPEIYQAREARAVELADRIVTHSPVTQLLYRTLYPTAAKKIHADVISWAEWILDGADRFAGQRQRFEEREIDVLFVASRWDRTVKNFPMVRQLARRLRDLRIHVVGEVPRRIRRVTHHGFVADREHMFRLLGNTRVLVCPSRWDAAPGVLFEAARMGANVVATPNCGNFELCHDQLLADGLDPAALERAVRRGLERPLPVSIEGFLVPSAYEELVQALEKA